MIYHPRRDDKDKKVALHNPSQPTSLTTWSHPSEVAVVVPDGDMPDELNGIPFTAWARVPESNGDWERLAAQTAIDEPPYSPPKHKKPAAGIVVEEEDGRLWLVAPSNGFGGYSATFPKGTVEAGSSRQATAIREALEEAGLQVEITGFLADVERSTSYTRYYRACRLGGHPALMGWESQAVVLVPRDKLGDYLTNPYDSPLLHALQRMVTVPREQRDNEFNATERSEETVTVATRAYSDPT
jgi:8-oxo-dGTP pyrophosphatase MutT (NUDIX family)